MTSETLPAADTAPAAHPVSTDAGLSAGHELARAVGIRRLVTATEELVTEGGTPAERRILRASAVAVLANPWCGTGTSEDLQPETERIAPVLAKLIADRLLDALGGADAVEAFGKAAVVGLRGEIEHAGALVHTPFFGNLVREFLEGTSIICFSDDRAEAGTSIRVPLWHKTAAATRSHYQTLDVHLADAPHPDELAVIAVASTGPRPHARIGDRTTDRAVTSEVLKGTSK
ncbi:peptide synthetase [Pseudoclavibacter endophyticus]|uniref:Amino acid synthesis family protein n=1 Tax=Pseudoclavibacter endophyticus TaxID=1778590 RepID=A0A6H9WPA9_9MICO|nr:amino acid synthesis family protein [Pseudoclavibacter endophyticus]KAB1649561.1 amino acid synthesis family protein [Pseudoclavibacter endophyticus]GGA61603.1 peptide synthetase [Pseudoclavibacter endophyticus]